MVRKIIERADIGTKKGYQSLVKEIKLLKEMLTDVDRIPET